MQSLGVYHDDHTVYCLNHHLDHDGFDDCLERYHRHDPPARNRGIARRPA